MRLRKRQQKRLINLVLSVVAGLLLLWLTPPAVEQLPAMIQPGIYSVINVEDGDTIIVDMNGAPEKVRFIGVDTPETKDPRKPVQCFGEAATAYTNEQIGNQPVMLKADPTNTNRDRYNRLLRYVYLPDGTLLNAKLIEQGYGFVYLSFPVEKAEEFRALEQQARQEERGLWSGCQPQRNDYGGWNSNPSN